MDTNRSASAGDSVADEAMRWAVGVDGLSPERRETLERWLHASDLHRAAFKKACRTWRSFDCLTELRDEPAIQQDMLAVIAQVKRRRTQRTATLLAASVAIVAIVFAVRWNMPLDHHANYVTAIGEQLTVGLPDDSVLLLNTNTTLTVHYADEGRTIELESGEAHFEVAHDPSRPFVVIAGNGIVRAVGTAFNVQYVDDEAVLVTVTDGIVDILQAPPTRNESTTVAAPLENGTPPVQRLSEGHNVKITNRVEAVEVIDSQALENQLAWQQGWLRFVNVPLGEVIAEANRYTTKTLLIADPALESHRVTVGAKANDIPGLLAVLDGSSNIFEVTSGPNGEVIISATRPQ